METLKAGYGDVCAILLQGKYNEWRKKLERKQEESPSCIGNVWDCSFRESRMKFSRYAGLEKDIGMETMLYLEMRYEKDKTGMCK